MQSFLVAVFALLATSPLSASYSYCDGVYCEDCCCLTQGQHYCCSCATEAPSAIAGSYCGNGIYCDDCCCYKSDVGYCCSCDSEAPSVNLTSYCSGYYCDDCCCHTSGVGYHCCSCTDPIIPAWSISFIIIGGSIVIAAAIGIGVWRRRLYLATRQTTSYGRIEPPQTVAS